MTSIYQKTKHTIFFICLFHGIAHAESVNELPKALKGIKRFQCHASDPIPVIKAASLRTMQADMSCKASVQEVGSLLSKPDTVLADLRVNMDFNHYHILNALNLNVADLHSKPYWRSKPVVLVDNGRNQDASYKLCSDLKSSGYKQVYVLQGGMPAWLVQNQLILGNAPSGSELARIGVADFWVESQNWHNVILLSPDQIELRKDLPSSLVLSQVSVDAIKSAIEHRKNAKNDVLASVILAAPTKFSDQQIQELQKALAPIPLLVYTDTAQAFTHQVTLQKAIWAEQIRGPKKLGCGL